MRMWVETLKKKGEEEEECHLYLSLSSLPSSHLCVWQNFGQLQGV
jgi:hypothetical protein